MAESLIAHVMPRTPHPPPARPVCRDESSPLSIPALIVDRYSRPCILLCSIIYSTSCRAREVGLLCFPLLLRHDSVKSTSMLVSEMMVS